MSANFFQELSAARLREFEAAWAAADGSPETARVLGLPENLHMMMQVVSFAEALAQNEPYLQTIKYSDTALIVMSDEWSYLATSVRARLTRRGKLRVEALHNRAWMPVLPLLDVSDQLHDLSPVVQFRFREHAPVTGKGYEYYLEASTPASLAHEVTAPLTDEPCQPLPGLRVRLLPNHEVKAELWEPALGANPSDTNPIAGSAITGVWTPTRHSFDGIIAWHDFVPGYECHAVINGPALAVRRIPADTH